MNDFHLFDLNMEGDKHLDLIRPFLAERHPNVICFQEIFADTAETLAQELQMDVVFIPLVNNVQTNDFFPRLGALGVAIMSRLPIRQSWKLAYVGNLSELPVYIPDEPHCFLRAVIVAEVGVGEQTFRLATTHFTWTPNGSVTERQHQDLEALLTVLKPYRRDLVLCGDFNAPRGKAIFSRLATEFIDHIPADITTTIDQHLHRKPGLQFVVDGMFSTPQYQFEQDEIITGVSDHCGVCAELTKTM